jgi:phage-related minor tail protein
LFELPNEAATRERKNLANQQQSSVRQSISSDPKTSQDQEARTDVRGTSSVHGGGAKVFAKRFKTRSHAGTFVQFFIRVGNPPDKQVVASPDHLKNSGIYID